MKVIGYGRVSTTDQDTTVQEQALCDAGCTVVLTEKKTGTKRQGRDQLEVALSILGPGDVLVVYKMDRLARSLKDLLTIYEEIKAKGAKLKVLDAPWIDGSIHGEMMMNVLGSLAQWETALRKERQTAGIQKAKAEGVYKGRKKQIDDDAIRQLKDKGLTIAQITRSLKVSRASIYRALA